MPLSIWTVVVCVCAAALEPAQCARILGVFAHPTTSNALFVHSVAGALASAGHDVTIYSPVKPPSGCGFTHHHIVTEFSKRLSKKVTYEWLMKEVLSKSGFGGGMMPSVSVDKCKAFLEHLEIQKLMRSNDTYDLVITSPFFGDEPLLLFAHKFQAVSVGVMPLGPSPLTNWWSGNSLSLAHVPDYIAFPFNDRMTLYQRLLNLMSTVVYISYHRWFVLPDHERLVARYAGDLRPPPPPVHEMLSGVSLVLVNAHPSLGYPRPWPPNIIPVGGIHINHKETPMNQKIQHFMDTATEGVVYCSLGSIVPVDSMPEELIQAFINVFKRIRQKVIWKMPETVFKGKTIPDNVMLSDWLPQKQVLGHQNTVLFVTHGGIGSQWETLHAGVPVVGIPFFADQPYNVRLYEELGVGLALPLDRLAEDTLFSAVHAVLMNSSYRANADRVSRIFRDLPVSPAQSAVYWLEYVISHKGAPHLKPRAATMPWHQRILADVLATLLFAAIVLLSLCRLVYRVVCAKLKKAKVD